NVPLLTINEKADREASIINGCLINGVKSLKLNFPFSLVVHDSLTKKQTIIAVMKNRTATQISTISLQAHAAKTPQTAVPPMAAIPILAPVNAIVFPREPDTDRSPIYANAAGISPPPANP